MSRANAHRSPADAFQPVLSVRARVQKDQVPEFIRATLHEIRGYIAANRIEVQGPPFSICRSASPNTIDVEAGWPVARARANGQIENGGLPVSWVSRGESANGARSHGLFF
jgi:hypothetical protein